ncbi:MULTISPECIES: DUF2489 domain-containing protein [Shewanella]|uniref:DUF2489 domain-containing protein n=1 Tax=Shewanella marisflavi TaxID=260364 RepID=A0AAC9XPW2_9GAMM|nr:MULTISPECIES: DUF2489 domain-containing protein [Shewanella]ASJ98410.1 hypothetical protein CFF01_18425 [Shewanella marisflavi]MCL1043331.1 DUF2489 domain-containing protein [Shewanella marisflavi]QDF77008.1 DUF2489 domain-containing protein [Shewanella marisflavi]
MTTTLLIIGALIILGLGGYALHLLLKLKKQTQQQAAQLAAQQAASEAREKELLGNIHYIAAAMLEERCELSEGVMRIGKLFEILGQSEQVQHQYPAFFKHFDIIKTHPIMEQRKALEKQQRMKLDFERMKSEAALEVEITEEAKLLVKAYAHLSH